jgi:uncharacterized membrane protein
VRRWPESVGPWQKCHFSKIRLGPYRHPVTKFLLAVHVIAAIVAIGPVTVAASMFPPAARKILDAPDDAGALATARLLHRICQVYAVAGVVVPVFGFATASDMGVLGDTWLIVSIALTALAAVVLAALVLPRQNAILESAVQAGAAREGTLQAGAVREGAVREGAVQEGAVQEEEEVVLVGAVDRTATVRLAMFTGIFNLLWATVTVLMIIRPGSTTGA